MSVQDGFNLWASKALFDLGMFVCVITLIFLIAGMYELIKMIKRS